MVVAFVTVNACALFIVSTAAVAAAAVVPNFKVSTVVLAVTVILAVPLITAVSAEPGTVPPQLVQLLALFQLPLPLVIDWQV